MPPVVDFLLHLDEHVRQIIRDHGAGAYAILAAIIFCETGLVFTPFLPGDSLLFATGMFCHPSDGVPGLNFWQTFGILSLAAVLGDNLNYQIGKRLGPWLFRNENSKFFKQSHLKKTHAFFEKYGGSTLIMARFVPVVRAFAPFVAGMGSMEFPRFFLFSMLGDIIWVGVCLGGGYLFGQIPWVQDNFEIMLLLVCIFSIIPLGLKIWLGKRAEKKAALKQAEANQA